MSSPLLDRDLFRGRRLALGQRQFEHALVVPRFGARRVEVALQRERAVLVAVVTLAANDLLALLLLGLLLHLGADRDLVAVDRHLDVVLVHARHLGLDAKRPLVLGDVHAHLRLLGQVAQERARNAERFVEVAERVVPRQLAKRIETRDVCHDVPRLVFGGIGGFATRAADSRPCIAPSPAWSRLAVRAGACIDPGQRMVAANENGSEKRLFRPDLRRLPNQPGKSTPTGQAPGSLMFSTLSNSTLHGFPFTISTLRM